MSARTFPTPWRVEISVGLRATAVTVVCDDGEDTMVCECYEGNYEQRVNAANLIAAAPELLTALKEILVDAELAGDKTSLHDIDVHLETIREVARAAVKKATGENK
jgi:hypothetical protein